MTIPKKYIDNYFKRFAEETPLIQSEIKKNCELIIVIPCHNEPDLIGTLESLLACEKPGVQVEVIIVVNQKAGSELSALDKQNTQATHDFNIWKAQNQSEPVDFHLIEALDMPKKHAGVGLARKIGMDEALRRFRYLNIDGTIACLDADCRVSSNYLVKIEEQFVKAEANLGEVSFEHRYELEKDLALSDGIVNYELFLRYYVEGLKQAGFPYAIQTIGSCMLVRASAYAKHGGMNKRKAGEDFYFLHKIIPHEIFVEVNEARVYPSCRTSDRVPFGTGKAQQDWLNQKSEAYMTYDPRVFGQLKSLTDSVEGFFSNEVEDVIDGLPEIPKAFIRDHGFESKIVLIKKNCKDVSQFRKQFFQWFDGFICMKFTHFVRDQYFQNIPIDQAVCQLKNLTESDPKRLLEVLRSEA